MECCLRGVLFCPGSLGSRWLFYCSIHVYTFYYAAISSSAHTLYYFYPICLSAHIIIGEYIVYICIFTCVAEGESRSRSAVTPSVCLSVRLSVRPSQNLVIATPLKLLIQLSCNLVCRYDIICSYAYRQEILIPLFLWE